MWKISDPMLLRVTMFLLCSITAAECESDRETTALEETAEAEDPDNADNDAIPDRWDADLMGER